MAAQAELKAFLRCYGQDVYLDGKEVKGVVCLPDVCRVEIKSSVFMFFKQKTRLKTRITPEEEANIFIKGKCEPDDLYEKMVSPQIGRGIFAKASIGAGRFLAEYCGALSFAKDVKDRKPIILISFHIEAKAIVLMQLKNRRIYHEPRFGRLVNHADKIYQKNAKMKVIEIDHQPHLALFSTREIKKEEEVRYDYGVKDLPWTCITEKRVEENRVDEPLEECIDEAGIENDSEDFVVDEPLEECLDEAGIENDSKEDFVVDEPLDECLDEAGIENDSKEDFEVDEPLEECLDEAGIENDSKEDFVVDEPLEECLDEAGIENDSKEDFVVDEPLEECIDEAGIENDSKEDFVVDEPLDECLNEDGIENDSKEDFVVDEPLEECLDEAGIENDSKEDFVVDEPLDECLDEAGIENESKEDFVVDEPLDECLDEGGIEIDSKEDFVVDEPLEECLDEAGIENDSKEDFVDIDDSDYNPADDSDDGNLVTNEGENGSITKQESDVGGSISGSEIDNESALYPQLCPEKLLKVQGSKDNSKGNLNNKKHACIFCEKLFPNISRHMTNKHANEHDVAKVLIKPVRSKERRKAWEELVNKGDFAHNYYAIEKGYGMVIPKYRSRSRKEDDDVKTLIPCQYCKGFYKKYELWKHQKFCVVQTQRASVLPSNHIQAGKLLLPRKCATELLHENVLIKMKEDEVKLIVLGDKHILQYGNGLYEQKGHEIQQHAYISCKLRELGRLLLEAKCIDTNIKTLLELMIASNWDLLVAAVRKVAEFNEETHTFGIPSLARKLGHSLKKIAETEYFESLKNNNNDTRSLSETFLQMYQLNWRKSIGSIAYSSLEENKYNKPQLLPLVEDVVKINKHLEESSKSLCRDIQADPTKFYPHLAKVCLAQVILFNRKRSGEAQRMTVKGFIDAKSGGYIDDTIKASLTLFEQKLCKSHLRVEIKGKKGRRVPVLLTEKMVFSLNILLKYRDLAGVSDNTLLFSRPGSAEHPYRGCDVLREFANCCNLKFPACINSTKLRKQLATLAQILNLKDNDQDILATFQGHDIRVHREFYRLPESTLQVAKISKLLHCLNNGTISKYKGCDFDSIQLENGETVENDEESDESENEEESEEIHDSPEIPAKKRTRGDASDQEDFPARKKSKGMRQRIYFTTQERATIAGAFRKEIRLQKVPGKLDVLNFLSKNTSFNKYPWTKVKFAVHNMITAIKRSSL